jgi:hypothetical protein
MRTVSTGMLPISCGYIDMNLLLLALLFANFSLYRTNSRISVIRQQSRVRPPLPTTSLSLRGMERCHSPPVGVKLDRGLPAHLLPNLKIIKPIRQCTSHEAFPIRRRIRHHNTLFCRCLSLFNTVDSHVAGHQDSPFLIEPSRQREEGSDRKERENRADAKYIHARIKEGYPVWCVARLKNLT